eukprot:12403046-Karenia_brevis.AAC.1
MSHHANIRAVHESISNACKPERPNTKVISFHANPSAVRCLLDVGLAARLNAHLILGDGQSGAQYVISFNAKPLSRIFLNWFNVVP